MGIGFLVRAVGLQRLFRSPIAHSHKLIDPHRVEVEALGVVTACVLGILGLCELVHLRLVPHKHISMKTTSEPL